VQSAVTCATFSHGGTLLITGSKDTDLIVWDVLAETGLFRLKGHKDQVTAVVSEWDRVSVYVCGGGCHTGTLPSV
jgi:WD40 repeat protein